MKSEKRITHVQAGARKESETESETVSSPDEFGWIYIFPLNFDIHLVSRLSSFRSLVIYFLVLQASFQLPVPSNPLPLPPVNSYLAFHFAWGLSGFAAALFVRSATWFFVPGCAYLLKEKNHDASHLNSFATALLKVLCSYFSLTWIFKEVTTFPICIVRIW